MKSLESARIARQERMLAKLYRYNGEVVTLETLIIKKINLGHVFEVGINPAVQFNRVKFNRMTQKEQDAYEKRLDATVASYRLIDKSSGIFMELPKLVFDYFQAKEEI